MGGVRYPADMGGSLKGSLTCGEGWAVASCSLAPMLGC